MNCLPPVLTELHRGTRQTLPLASGLEYFGYALWLGGPVCIMILAATMSVGPGRAVSLPGIGQLPETCTLHTRLGIDCPGCGLTRSFIHLAHGRVQAAWNLNIVAPFMFAYVAGQIPLALFSFWSAFARRMASRPQAPASTSEEEQPPRSSDWVADWAQYNQWLLVGLMLALLVRWGVYLVTGELI